MKDTTAAVMRRKFLDEYSKTLNMKASAEAARYGKKAGIAIAHNIFKNPAAIKELEALCERKAEYLEICPGYIIFGYLKVLKWALSADEGGKPNDPALALRALEGITRQLGSDFSGCAGGSAVQEGEIPIITEIIGLDTNKI